MAEEQIHATGTVLCYLPTLALRDDLVLKLTRSMLLYHAPRRDAWYTHVCCYRILYEMVLCFAGWYSLSGTCHVLTSACWYTILLRDARYYYAHEGCPVLT